MMSSVTMSSAGRPYFVTSKVPRITYMRGEVIENNPPNIALCRHICKDRLAWYPDNVGKPGIHFVGCDVRWFFDSEAERDAEFDRVLAMFSVKEFRDHE